MWHNNFVRSKQLKDYRAKEMGLYMLDEDGEYSANSNRYFTITLLRSKKNTSTGIDKHIQKAITKAINISNKLNRSFVIPPITCKTGKSSFCNLCYYDRIICFHDIMLSASLPFKESVLIMILVNIRHSFQTNVYLIIIDKNIMRV